MTASVGIVKWYGGHNRKKGTENKFGFLQDISGSDVFLHESEWKEDAKPTEDQIVCYTLTEEKGKVAAKNAESPLLRNFDVFEAVYQLCKDNQGEGISKLIELRLDRRVSSELKHYSDRELDKCVELLGKEGFYSSLVNGNEWGANFEYLTSKGFLEPLDELSWECLPRNFIAHNAEKVSQYLQTLTEDEAKRQVKGVLDQFTNDLLLFVLLAQYIELSKENDRFLSRANSYVREIYLGKATLPEYVKRFIDEQVKPKGGVMKAPLVGEMFSYHQFKKYLFERDPKFVSLYESSSFLQSRIDIFVLKEIFALVFANNPVERIYELFLGQLWSAISAGKIDPISQSDLILELFPACNTMPKGLSCEAVYWKKQNTYLCRGSQCNLPKVTANTEKHYLDFTIYDWFGYYGINYLEDGQPSNRDFPIKLAGYFNRLREIFDVIHCRSCQSLMLPDMKYARVEYTAIEDGKFVKKDMAPAYRLTVFKCPDTQCSEHGAGHYINHCLGFDCYQLIDDRDCKAKCDAGLYICKGCGSCCSDHAKNNPVGLCPDCGSPLKLFETKQYDSYSKKHKRFAQCSQQHCGFEIPPEDLSKRFYLDSCVPVIKTNKEPPEKNFEFEGIVF